MEGLGFFSDIGTDKVCDVLAVRDFWDDIHLPFRVRENIVLW